MSNIENRIVSMTFDNERFERNLAATMVSLDKLTESLQFAGTQESLSGLSKQVGDFDMSKMASAVENVSSKFSVLGAVAFTVIQSITRSTIDLAKNIGRKVIDPLMAGGRQRALNLEQAKFLFRGLDMDIEATMASALKAVEGTAYGLDAAAKAAAQMGGSGLKAGDEMTGALRGIAGIAAMTNSSYEEMADIFITAAGNGKVMSMELGRISHRGVNAAAALAKQWGMTEAEVRQMATEGEISFEMFAKGMDDAFGEHAQKANETYTGSLANMRAAMSRLGASFFGDHLRQQRDLFNALRPVIDDVHDALKPLITAFLEFKELTNKKIINFLENLDFTKFSTALILVSHGLKNIFDFAGQLSGALKEAFRDIFPKTEASLVLKLASAFKDLTEKLKMGGKTVESVKSIFRGIFSVIAIGMEIVKGVGRLFFDVFSSLAEATGIGGGALRFFANLGEALASLKRGLVDGGGIADFFDGISKALKSPIEAIGRFKDAISSMFGNSKDVDDTTHAVDRVNDRMGMLATLAERAGKAWQWLSDRFKGIRKVLDEIWTHMSTWFSELGTKLAKVMKPSDYNAAVDVVNVGLLGGIALLLKHFLSGGINLRVTTGVIERMRLSFIGLTRSLKAMQMDLRAKALLKIAAAVGILAVSMLVLSTIDSVALTKALVAMSVGFGQLIGAMTLMEKLSVGTSALKMGILAVGMMILATAAVILSLAVKNLASLGWEELTKGLIGITVMLGGLTASTKLIAADTSGIIRAGIAMIGMSIALFILSKAVKSFADLSWGEMLRGLVGVAVGLGLIVLAMNFMPKGMVAQGVGLIAIAVGLRLLANAVLAFADISWNEMLRGFVGVGAGLLVIAGAMQLMPPGMIFTAAGILILSVAMTIMAKAVRSMGDIDMGELAKGIGAFAAMLLILAISVSAMSGAIGGAFALLIVSGALLVLAKVLKEIGKLSIAELITGLVAIAAALVILGLAALVLKPVIPALLLLGVALTLLGIGFALFGAGAALVAKAFEIMAKAGKTGVAVFIEVINMFLAALPGFIGSFISALISMVTGILEVGPLLIKAITVLLGHILDSVIELAPKIAEALGEIISEALLLMREKFPEVVETGFEMLLAFLTGIRDNIGEIVTLVSEIIQEFLGALEEEVPDIVDSFYNLLLTVVTEVAEKIGENTTAFIPVGKALIDGFLEGLENNLPGVLDWFKELPGKIIDIIKGLFGIKSPSTVFSAIGGDLLLGLLKGLGKKVVDVITWFTGLPGKILGWIGNVLTTLKDKGIALIGGLLTGIISKAKEITTWFTGLPGKILGWIGNVATKLKDKGTQIIGGFYSAVLERAKRVKNWFTGLPGRIGRWVGGIGSSLFSSGKAIIKGLWDGILSAKDWIVDKAGSIGDWVSNPVGKALSLFSPSRLFRSYGVYIGQGLIQGLDKVGPKIQKTSGELAETLVKGFDDGPNFVDVFNETLNRITDSISDMDELHPVITPVLDLSKVEAASKTLDDLISVSSISPEASIDRARLISTTADHKDSTQETPVQTGPNEVTFEQNIYSPTALSVNDIYRNTKSQIALAKEELNIS